jgi:hypothetical protein
MYHVNFRRFLWLVMSKSAAFYVGLLVIIQVGIGVMMKVSQGPAGNDEFSISASLAIAELLKFLISILFFYRECTQRQSNAHLENTSQIKPFLDNSLESAATSSGADKECQHNCTQNLPARLDLRSFWTFCVNEISVERRYSIGQLALLYALLCHIV